MTDEVFADAQAKEAYESFPADLPAADWMRRLEHMVKILDREAKAGAASWSAGATARKARDVVLYTLEDERIPKLMAALVQAMPVLQAMRQKAQENLMKGVQPEDNIRVNKWMKDLFDALQAMQQ